MQARRLLRSPAATAALVAAVVYSDWIVLDRLPREHDARHRYVSELAARGEPYAFLLNALDAAAAATFIALSAELFRLYGTSRLRKLGAASFALFGIGAAAGAVFPMSAGARGADSWTDTVHAAASTAEFGGLLASIVLLACALRREPEWRGVAVLWLALAPAYAGLAAYVGIRALHEHVAAAGERALVLASSVWIASVATAAIRRRPVSLRRSPSAGRRKVRRSLRPGVVARAERR
jgi:Protein of unknown function (DUF998)